MPPARRAAKRTTPWRGVRSSSSSLEFASNSRAAATSRAPKTSGRGGENWSREVEGARVSPSRPEVARSVGIRLSSRFHLLPGAFFRPGYAPASDAPRVKVSRAYPRHVAARARNAANCGPPRDRDRYREGAVSKNEEGEGEPGVGGGRRGMPQILWGSLIYRPIISRSTYETHPSVSVLEPPARSLARSRDFGIGSRTDKCARIGRGLYREREGGGEGVYGGLCEREKGTARGELSRLSLSLFLHFIDASRE